MKNILRLGKLFQGEIITQDKKPRPYFKIIKPSAMQIDFRQAPPQLEDFVLPVWEFQFVRHYQDENDQLISIYDLMGDI